jgi:hypothetical protein
VRIKRRKAEVVGQFEFLVQYPLDALISNWSTTKAGPAGVLLEEGREVGDADLFGDGAAHFL